VVSSVAIAVLVAACGNSGWSDRRQPAASELRI